ncbi:MAG: nitroreductase family protein [Bacteroidales bacterium]
MKLLESIKNRYSPRAFSSKPVEKEKIEAMFEAARWAPSSYNKQPWSFIYATRDNEETWDKLFDSLVEFNQIWVKNAPLLIMTAVRNDYKHAYHDLGLAVGNMMNQVTGMGLYMHQMGGFDPEKAAENINLPEGLEAHTMIAVGYKGSLDVLPQDFQEMEKQERVRKPLEEMVFTEAFK